MVITVVVVIITSVIASARTRVLLLQFDDFGVQDIELGVHGRHELVDDHIVALRCCE